VPAFILAFLVTWVVSLFSRGKPPAAPA